MKCYLEIFLFESAVSDLATIEITGTICLIFSQILKKYLRYLNCLILKFTFSKKCVSFQTSSRDLSHREQFCKIARCISNERLEFTSQRESFILNPPVLAGNGGQLSMFQRKRLYAFRITPSFSNIFVLLKIAEVD